MGRTGQQKRTPAVRGAPSNRSSPPILRFAAAGGITYSIEQLGPSGRQQHRSMLALFDDRDTEASAPPPEAYLDAVLASSAAIPLVAVEEDAVIGTLVADVLPKVEQARSEVSVDDLAVTEPHRRRGIAAALKPVARAAGAWVIFVQADHGDSPAIALYTGLGVRENVLHFDIPAD